MAKNTTRNSDLLRQIRLESGLSQADMAAILKMRQGVISLWERGITTPDVAATVRYYNHAQKSCPKLLMKTKGKPFLFTLLESCGGVEVE